MSEKEIKHIYWFAYYHLDSPSVRYRARYPLEFAERNLGISSRLIIPGYSPKRLLNFLQAYISALIFPKKDSLIVIQRVRSGFIYASLLKLLIRIRKSKTVYDLDDADYLEYNPDNIHYFAVKCRFISAGSTEIVRYLRRFNQNVVHVTSPVPDLGIMKEVRNEIFTIGWIGGYSWGHKESLFQYVFPAIAKLKFKYRFILMGVMKDLEEKEIREYFKHNGYIKLELPRDIDWNNERSIQNRITEFDVGIATLANSPVQLSKSGIKAKQYMNNGIPVLCNDLPENNKIVINGMNGFVCKDAGEFVERLLQFKEMEEKTYWEFSGNARASIRNFNHIRYFEDLKILINGRRPSAGNDEERNVMERSRPSDIHEESALI